ncbi:HlyD family efflux transporter periplasmic adaptor subunit [Lagierella sp. ICN-221743]
MKITRRKRKFKITPQILILLLLILVIARNVYSKQFKSKTLELSSIDNYESTLNLKGPVIREEYLISYGETLNTDKDVMDKISANSNIGSINGFKNNLDLNLEYAKKQAEKLNKIEDIYHKKRQKEDTKDDKDENKSAVAITSDYIYEKVKNNELESLKNLKEIDYNNINKNREELNYLKNKYNVASEVLSKNGENLKVSVSGVLINKVDGYEDILDPYEIDLENFEFKIPSSKYKTKAIGGSKIVNNNFFYLYFKVPNSKLNGKSEVGDRIKIKIEKEYLEGEVSELFDDGKSAKFLIKFDQGFNLIENTRFLDFKLVKDEEKAFLIPTSSLVKKDELWGAFVKNPSGIVEFKAVKIISEDGKNTFVSIGKDGMITFGGKNYKTLDLYDEVLLHPKLVKDNELLE